MRKVTVSVGIPAYNEEANIKNLILSLLKQVQTNFILKEIIVVSDMSTDNTDQEVKSVRNKKIKLIRNKKRLGQALGQNKMLKTFDSDVLVLINADMYLKNMNFLKNIIKPLIADQDVGIVGAKLIPVDTSVFFERVINFSVQLKLKIFEAWLNGNNLFLCRGGARAFSKFIAKKITWPKGLVAEDCYSYMYCLKKGKKFIYSSSAIALYKSPSNLNDHLNQHQRFAGTKSELNKYFDKKFVTKSMNIPISLLIKHSLLYSISHPIEFITYSLIYLTSLILPEKEKSSSVWAPPISTKNIKF